MLDQFLPLYNNNQRGGAAAAEIKHLIMKAGDRRLDQLPELNMIFLWRGDEVDIMFLATQIGGV